MTNAWTPGEHAALLVEAPDGTRTVMSASLLVFEETLCRLRLAEPLAEDRQRPMMVSLGMGREQRFAPVVQSEHHDGELSVWTPNRWYRASDRRAHPRYPVLLTATISSGDVTSSARCLDISAMGAAVETPFWRPDSFVLSITHDGHHLRVPCVTVSSAPFLSGTMIHAQFGPMDADTRARIDDLVTQAGAEFADAQLFLVGRANDSIQPLR